MSGSEDPNDQGSRSFRYISDFFSLAKPPSQTPLVSASDDSEEDETPIIVAHSRAAVLESTDASSFITSSSSFTTSEDEREDATEDYDSDSYSSDVEILISVPSSESDEESYEETESELEMTLPTKKSKIEPPQSTESVSKDVFETDESIYIEPKSESVGFVLTKESLSPIESVSDLEAMSKPGAGDKIIIDTEAESDIQLNDDDLPIAAPLSPIRNQKTAFLEEKKLSEPVVVVKDLKPPSLPSSEASAETQKKPLPAISSPPKVAAALAKLSPVRVFFADPDAKAAEPDTTTKVKSEKKPPMPEKDVISSEALSKPAFVPQQVSSVPVKEEISAKPIQQNVPLPSMPAEVTPMVSNLTPSQPAPTISIPVPLQPTAPAVNNSSSAEGVDAFAKLMNSKPASNTLSAATENAPKPSATLRPAGYPTSTLPKAPSVQAPQKPAPPPQKPTQPAQSVQAHQVNQKPAQSVSLNQPAKPAPVNSQPNSVLSPSIQNLLLSNSNSPKENTAPVLSQIKESTPAPVNPAAPLSVSSKSDSDGSISAHLSSRLTIDLPSSSGGSVASLSPLASTVSSSSAIPPQAPPKTAYVYDKRMLLHKNQFEIDHPECPDRISRIYDNLKEAGLLKKSRLLPVSLDSMKLEVDLLRVHDSNYHKSIQETAKSKDLEEFAASGNKFNSVYLNEHSAMSASIAAAATVQLCRAVARGDYENGFAIVRPPGHHAEHDEAMGFCLYNNVAVAAKNLYDTGLAKRILILDWDVHHGNGTQNAFVENPDVLYVSIHRYDNGNFYPHMDEANHTFVGVKPALGRSVNVAWNGSGIGDGDYLYAFSRLIMPIAREFNPDFVIVSAGFDAAQGDPIGQCMVTPFGYASMLHELMALAGGRVAVVLEGGYDLDVITRCYEACVRTLLHEPLPKPPTGGMVSSLRGAASIESAVCSQSPYWRCLFPKLAEMPNANAEVGVNKDLVMTPMKKILETYWREECKSRFNLQPMPLIFSSIKDQEFVSKYVNQVLIQEQCLFGPDMMIVMAHESGPLLHNGVVPSMCIQSSRVSQYTPFLDLMQVCSTLSPTHKIGLVDICVPSRLWKLKQQSFGDERECEELKVLMLWVWDQLILRSGCKNVIFIAAGAPTFGIANLIHRREVIGIIQGLYFFSSSLFLPLVDSPVKSQWYKRNAHVVVPSSQERGAVIPGVHDKFGKCISGGQVLMADSGAMISSFMKELTQFIQQRTQIK